MNRFPMKVIYESLVHEIKERKSGQRLFSLPNCYNEYSTFDIFHTFVYYIQNVYHVNVYDIHVYYILFIVLWILCTLCASLHLRISHKCINIRLYILSIRNDRCRFGRCSTLSLHRGSSHGKSIVGQFHRPGKILLLSFPSSSSVEISFSFSLSPPISPFISRRSAYSYSPNALFANLPARIAEEDVNKQDRYFFAASEWEFMRAAREKQIVFYIFLDFLLSLDKLARSAGVRE